jgi:hypothetical protein
VTLDLAGITVYHRRSPRNTRGHALSPRHGPRDHRLTDSVDLVRGLGTRFIARRDIKSWQSSNGDWHPQETPMSMADFEAHLAGTHTMGHYMINPEDQTCKLFAFDLDLRKPSKPDVPGEPPVVDPYRPTYEGTEINPRELLYTEHPLATKYRTDLRVCAEGIATRVSNTMGISVAIAESGGKGLHVYCFTGSIPGEAAQAMAHNIMETWLFEPVRGKNFWRHVDPTLFPDIEIETFPKQATVQVGGMGNLMKLPLGVNQKTKKRSRFLTMNASLDQWVEMDPIRVFEGELPWE